jgi:hypothetical protein
VRYYETKRKLYLQTLPENKEKTASKERKQAKVKKEKGKSKIYLC